VRYDFILRERESGEKKKQQKKNITQERREQERGGTAPSENVRFFFMVNLFCNFLD
jgi:hypothetical protein